MRPYFDLTAVEKSMREQFAELDRMQGGNSDFIGLQKGLREAIIQVNLWAVKAANDNASPSAMMNALAIAVGQMFMALAGNMSDRDAVLHLLFEITAKVVADMTEGDNPDMVSVFSCVEGEKGGRA